MKYINQLIERYPCLDVCKKDIEDAAKAIIKSYENGGKLSAEDFADFSDKYQV